MALTTASSRALAIVVSLVINALMIHAMAENGQPTALEQDSQIAGTPTTLLASAAK